MLHLPPDVLRIIQDAVPKMDMPSWRRSCTLLRGLGMQAKLRYSGPYDQHPGDLFKDAAHAMRTFKEHLTVVSVTFENINLHRDEAEHLARHLSCLQSLTTLRFDECSMRVSGMSAIGESLPSLTSLRRLDFRVTGLHDSDAIVLASHLQHVPSLTALTIERMDGDYGIGVYGGAALARRLPTLTLLTELVLSHGRPGADTINEISVCFTGLSVLRTLHLDGQHLNLDRMQTIGPRLSNLVSLTDLHLDDNDINGNRRHGIDMPSAMESLFRGIGVMTGLRCLSLRANSLHFGGVYDFTQCALPSTIVRTLVELYLGDNDITSHGLAKLSTILPSMTALHTLGLGYNNFLPYNGSAPGMAAFASVLPSVQSLRVLDFGHSVIRPDEAEGFVSGLAHSPSLTELDLSSTGLDSNAAALLLQINSLKHLIVDGNDIGDDIMEQLSLRHKLFTRFG